MGSGMEINEEYIILTCAHTGFALLKSISGYTKVVYTFYLEVRPALLGKYGRPIDRPKDGQ